MDKSDVSLQDYVRASYPVIMVETFDPSYTEERIERLVADLTTKSNNKINPTVTVVDLRSLKGQVSNHVDNLQKADSWSITVLRNMHFFLKDNSFLQALQNFVTQVQKDGKPIILIGTCPSIDEIPPEVAREVVVVRDPLPTEDELLSYLGDLAAIYHQKGVRLTGEMAKKVARIGRGMTRSEFKRAFRLSIVKMTEIDPRLFVEVKKQILKESSALDLYQPDDDDLTLTELAGMDRMKFYVQRVEGRGRGILIMGPPGTGKTVFAKAKAAHYGRPLLMLDVGSLFHGIVGSSESRMRRMIATVEAFGECDLLVDEIEKGFAGVGGSNSTDGGTTQRTLSKFLTWLSERKRLDASVTATCNAMRMPPEYVRAGRFSAIFYLKLPSKSVRAAAWKIHMKRFGLEDTCLPDDDGWSGAEIAQCCETAHDMRVSLKQASGYVTLVSKVAREQLNELDKFAEEAGLIPADDPDDEDEVEAIA